MLHISRRYVKHFAIPDPSDEITGYKSMAELCKDVDDVINILWLSGTRKCNTYTALLPMHYYQALTFL